MPTNMVTLSGGWSMTRACRSGLALGRPKRLSGLVDVAADGAPHSATGSCTPADVGLPSTVSLAGPCPAGN
jgi:hypothetical protein